MSTKLFYFTGTGNTLCIAKNLAEKLGDATVEPVTRANPIIDNDVDTVGIIFPVYGWGMPNIVGAFVDRLENCTGKYVFAVCNYGGTLFASLKSIQRRLQKKGIALDAGFALRMPVNYIPIFTVLSPEKQKKILDKAMKKTASIASIVKKKEKTGIETWKVPVINGLLLSMHEAMMANVNNEDKKYWVNDKCNGCGICKKVCPVGNISLSESGPVWNHACQECMACVHWCPPAAIQYGKAPERRGRYHNPEVSLQEMMGQQIMADLKK
jgi:ferredoxin